MRGIPAIREEDAVRVRGEDLLEAVAGVFVRLGVPPDDARLGADVVVEADLRGVDSHGVSNMLRSYVEGLRSGQHNPAPQPRLVREGPATATMDCDRGLGIIVAPRAMEVAVRKARGAGIGAVALANGRHLGMAGYHAMLALRHDMIGVCMTAPGPRVVPTFGREPRLGTNPIAVAVPAMEEPALVLDMATSVAAVNALYTARRLGVPVPPGVVADGEGRPVMEPAPVPERFNLLPLGSTPEMASYKGYGLACVVEVLCSMLSGAGAGPRQEAGEMRHFVAAIDVAAFTPVRAFKLEMDRFIRGLRSTPTAPGAERVLVPGQPEWEAREERLARGIPLHREVVEWLRSLCREMGVPFQAPRPAAGDGRG